MSDDYHADRGTFTHSALKNAGWWDYRGEFNETPHLMKAWLGGADLGSETRSKDLGTVTHMLCEGKSYQDICAAYLIAPECKRGTKAWDAWVATLPDPEDAKKAVKQSELDKMFYAAREMHKNLLHHDALFPLLAKKGEHEKEVRAVCRVSGLPLKCKPDFRQPGEFFIDWKTTKDPDPAVWLPQAKSMGYHRQAALYRYIIELATGKRERCIHAVVRSDEPYTAAVYEFPEAALSEAHAQNLHVLRCVAMRRDWNEWTPDWAKGINTEWEVLT